MESEDDLSIDPNKILTFNIQDTPITIGRISSKIIINSTCVSKQHAIIEYNKDEATFLYKDLQSTNGSILIMIYCLIYWSYLNYLFYDICRYTLIIFLFLFLFYDILFL